MLRARKRITKRELKEDKLVTYTFKLNSYLRENAKRISYIVLGSAALILIITYVSYSTKKTEREAMSEVGIAQIFYQRGDINGAKIRFEKVSDEYEGTKSAGLAAYFAADIKFRLGEFEEAKKYFQSYLDDKNDNDILTSS